MVDDVLQPLCQIEHICDELLSQQYGSLAERQIEKTTIIQTQVHALAQYCQNYVSSTASTEAEKSHKLWGLCSEFRTPTTIINTAIYFLRVYDTNHVAVLNTQQQKHLQYMQNQVDILNTVLDKIVVDLQRYIEGADAG